MTKIALDAMGGDFAPRETVQGGVLAVQDAEVLGMANHDLEVVLVGRKEDIEKELSHIGGYPKKSISIIDAREVVEMGKALPRPANKKGIHPSSAAPNSLKRGSDSHRFGGQFGGRNGRGLNDVWAH